MYGYYYPKDDKKFNLHTDIRSYFYYVFFPPVITDDDLAYVEVYPMVYQPPRIEAHQIAEETVVAFVDGQWAQQWAVRDRTPEEMPVDPEPEPPVQSGN